MPSPDSAKSWSGSIGNNLSEVEPPGADRPFDDPAGRAQPAAMLGAALRDHRLDVASPQLRGVRLRVVRPVALDPRRAEAWPAAPAPELREGIDQREELGNVVIIRTRERRHQRD